jgi:hypothetical protein
MASIAHRLHTSLPLAFRGLLVGLYCGKCGKCRTCRCQVFRPGMYVGAHQMPVIMCRRHPRRWHRLRYPRHFAWSAPSCRTVTYGTVPYGSVD